MAKRQVLQGNNIVAKAALIAGCDFFAGYPITPSSEIAQYMSKEMPRLERVFIQMEDEIASIGACIGASLAGKKVLTATSGPGYSLMQEHLGMGVMAEVPMVIANVMRGGPSTGMPTKPSQSDIMQTKWGSHGDYPIITLYPATADEIFSETIRAFNLSEKYWNPVILLLDEVIAKAHEDLEIPSEESIELVVNESKEVHDLNIYDRSIGDKPPRVDFFQKYPIHIDSLEHDARGYPCFEPENAQKMQNLRMEKINKNIDDIVKFNDYRLDDAEIMIFSFGISARAAKEAVDIARSEGIKVGLFQALTIWPFPEKALNKYFKKIDKVLTVELNMGQTKYEIDRVAPKDVTKKALLRANGVPFTPAEIVAKLKEEY
jgi:2-oxoglutarate ferredoxin oxidoreductase subunit alpha